MFSIATLRREWLSNPRGDILAGIVVALALIPEAIGFSIIAGVDPKVGLYASFSIAVIAALVGGRPGMISAATAAIAVLVVPLIRDHGVEYLFAATILMGVLQVIAGFARLDLLMQYVSTSVVTGFVNALAILIFVAQLPQLINVTWVTYAMVAAGLAIIYLLPRLTRVVPSPLVAIVVLTIVSIYGGLGVNTVGDMGQLPSSLPYLLIPEVPLTLETLRIIFPYSVTMAIVGLLESMMTAHIVDELTDTPSDKRRECKGQGHRQLCHRVPRRHGRLRHDRPVGHQCEIRRQYPIVHFRSGQLPAVPDCCPGTAGQPDSDAVAGCSDDHGVDRHVQLEIHQEPENPSLAVIGGHGGDGCRGCVDTRPGAGRAGRRCPERIVLCQQGQKPVYSHLAPVCRRRLPDLQVLRTGVLRLNGTVHRCVRLQGSA